MKKMLIGIAASAVIASPAFAVDEVAFATDFDSAPTVGAGVGVAALSNGALDTALNPVGNWTGNFFSNTSTGDGSAANLALQSVLTLSNLPTHTGVNASFILGFMNSWDSYNGGCCQPDYLDVFIDGNLVATMTYDNAFPGSIQDIDGGTLLSQYGQHGAGSYYSDTLVDMNGAPFLTFAHTGNSLSFAIQARGAGWQGGGDESWGIDDLNITLTDVTRIPTTPGVPEPANWAMMIGGFGMVGAAMRRRAAKVALA